ncbi:MAG: DUF3887 domain-containing protein [Cyanobacteriota bacterium]|nr:DUF3887 domain-containing protein [Cyanobacteriota bacterium]
MQSPTPTLPRMPRRIGLIGLALAAGLVGGDLRARAQQGGLPLGAGAELALPANPAAPSSAAVVEARARAAADRILGAMRDGDANARFAQFAPTLQRISSPALVAANMKRQPKLMSWTITSVVPAFDASTVEAELRTSAGTRKLLLVINGDGKLEVYHLDASDQAAERVARDFVQAVVDGRFVAADGFLSPDLQSEIPPASLQRKWLNLQTRTGNFVRVREVLPSEQSGEMKLVMVTTEFTRLTDNLYVILDRNNAIIGVDFPTEPAAPKPAPSR